MSARTPPQVYELWHAMKGGEQMFDNARHEANVEKLNTEIERRTA